MALNYKLVSGIHFLQGTVVVYILHMGKFWQGKNGKYLANLGVGGIDKYHTTVFKIKILRYN